MYSVLSSRPTKLRVSETRPWTCVVSGRYDFGGMVNERGKEGETSDHAWKT